MSGLQIVQVIGAAVCVLCTISCAVFFFWTPTVKGFLALVIAVFVTAYQFGMLAA